MAAKLYRRAQAAAPDRTVRIEPFTRDKVLILSLFHPKSHSLSLQRSIERATPYQPGSRRRSITNAFGESPP
jgi:hypothetical protein